MLNLSKLYREEAVTMDKKARPKLSDEARESYLINLAMDNAEKQLLDGTASSQVVAHFLKLGTEKAKLERENLAHQNQLIKAKTEALESAKRIEELYSEALNAMRNYGGQGDSDEY